MNRRERVMMALSHREADRVPRDLGGTESSGLTGAAFVALCEHLKLNETPRIFEPYQYVAEIPPVLLERFKIDTLNLTPQASDWTTAVDPAGRRYTVPVGWREELLADKTVVRDQYDNVIAERPDGSFYFDPVYFPLADIDDAAELDKFQQTIMNYDWPSFADESIMAMCERAVQQHASGSCVVLNLCCHFLAAGMFLRGIENFMVDLICNEKLVEKLFAMLLESYLQRIDRLAPELKDVVDVVLFNDDLGSQTGPLISPAHYRKFLKPCQSKMFKQAKSAFGSPILFHSCGAVREFIPDLIECGVDALNPVQFSAAGMDLQGLKADFGQDITFWGGGADSQNILNSGTPEIVRDHVRRNLDIMAPGGGFVFTQVHNIQPDVSPENILAMYQALEEY
ncbi:MAG: hypothetical protein L3J71_11890 [Victivallaceae bacterium]|nr:hypothetical protein [Victivallaceae bacterium]